MGASADPSGHVQSVTGTWGLNVTMITWTVCVHDAASNQPSKLLQCVWQYSGVHAQCWTKQTEDGKNETGQL